MKRLWWLSAVVAVAAVVSVAVPAGASEPSATSDQKPPISKRKSAKDDIRQVDKSIQAGRAQIDKDIPELSRIATWILARPIGDDPRVLAFCDEVIVKSTTTRSALRGTDCLETAVIFHRDELAQKRLLPRIRVSAEHALGKDSVSVNLAGAKLLFSIGAKNDSYAAYSRVFQKASNVSLDDDTKWDLIRAINALLDVKVQSLQNSILDVTSKQNLLDYFKQNISDERAPGRGEDLQIFLRNWQAKKTK
jgi:hypothetical protein